MKNGLGDVQSVLVLGGGSDIGQAVVRALVRRRCRTVVLAARCPDDLAGFAAELRAVDATTVDIVAFDADRTDEHDAVVEDVFARHGDIDVVVLAFGVLDGPPVAMARTNYVGGVSAGLAAAEALRRQGHGTLVVLSSVAGQRVRKANYVYGSTKAGLDSYAQGLGDSLAGSGVTVLVVRPGFVDTKMTAGRQRASFATTAGAVATAVVRGIASDREVVWVPSILRYVFAVFRHLPRPLWRRMPN